MGLWMMHPPVMRRQSRAIRPRKPGRNGILGIRCFPTMPRSSIDSSPEPRTAKAEVSYLVIGVPDPL